MHLADEHHLESRFVVSGSIQIDEAIHLLKLLLTIGRNHYLRNARYRHMIRCLDDTVALVFRHNANYGILRARLPEVF